ncbi:MAG: sigma-70 family RNA polymerase sigma factor [Clostridia bacterium]|nr:sigma-70 family RNA polymerase sigma factor [Clostridia bacterium]
MDNGASSYRRFLDGDKAAFDDIMKDYFYGLVFFIDRYVRDTHAAEDIAMDSFCELIVNKHRYNFKVSLKTYLYMLGRSRAIDYIRHKKVIKTTELTDDADISDGVSLEELVLTEERKRRVHKAIASLPKDMGVAVHLIYFEDMSYADAARIMKKTAKQVDNLLYRAKKELRAILGEDGEQLL